MITATILVLIFAPLFYVLIEKLFGKRKKLEAIKMDDDHPAEDR
jgi:HAE1 family hydrophobic/amphiphilic exporter-1